MPGFYRSQLTNHQFTNLIATFATALCVKREALCSHLTDEGTEDWRAGQGLS